jgi:F0F1-type ATP synthase membrane subunit b/b'
MSSRRGRRATETFSMSFLDIMSCGFGAIVLFFVIINATMAKRADELNRELHIRAEMLRLEVADGEENLVELRNTLEDVEKRRVIAQGRAQRIIELIRERREELATLEESTVAQRESIERLQADLLSLDEESRRLSAAARRPSDEGARVRAFVGDGDRQYVTGLRVGGSNVLILLDASASMLDETIVNVIRRRNMRDEQKLAAPKWQRTLATLEWITTQLPPDSSFQVYRFAETAEPLVAGSGGRWLETADPDNLDEAIRAARRTIPHGGTSLWHAFDTVRRMDPRPDNVFLITDGLPTMGEARPRATTVTGAERMRHFEQAARLLPGGVPVNVILLPMEGDAEAASAFWRLAIGSRGAYLAPSRDWP